MSLLKKYLSERSRPEPEPEPKRVEEEEEEEEEEGQSRQSKQGQLLPPPISQAIHFRDHFKKFIMEDERLSVPVDSVSYVPDAVSEYCGNRIMENVESVENQWTQLKTRKLLCFGGLPEKGRKRDPLPPWLEEIAEVLVDRNIFPAHLPPNHVLINYYQPGEGIMHHTDGPLYHDRVVILSFGFPAIMSFHPRLSSAQIGASSNVVNAEKQSDRDEISSCGSNFSIMLRPNSMLYFSKDAYVSYMHGIDTWDPCTLETWTKSFDSYVSNITDVVDKTSGGNDRGTTKCQGGGELCTDASCVRISLTIRHMF